MRRFWRYMAILAAATALLRFVPELSTLWREHISAPILGLLNRLTSPISFPVLEPLAVALLALCLRRRGRVAALALVVGMYGILWYPAYFANPTPRAVGPVDAEALCVQLIRELNAAELDFESPFESAGNVAGLPRARVKVARYPEWMRAMKVAGLFSPWTGEVIVDAGVPPWELPFTCVHELQHLRGVADEGAANLAAYRACMDHGGMYADSARLWALRYALGRLDDAARTRVLRRASGRLRPLLSVSSPPVPSPVAALLGIGKQTSDYDGFLDAISGQDG